MLSKFADKIWTVPKKLRFLGLEVGTRMTVVELGDGDLFVHSPVTLDAELKNQIEALGNVKYVVAPNRWHHLYINDFKEGFPAAKFFCAPGLEKKRSDFSFDGVMEEKGSYLWSQNLSHHIVNGIPFFNEVVFFHRDSKTLILTDLALHIWDDSPWLTRFSFKLLGAYGKLGWSKMERLLFIKDRKLFNQSIERILEWDFDRIILAHGRAVESKGRELLRKAFL